MYSKEQILDDVFNDVIIDSTPIINLMKKALETQGKFNKSFVDDLDGADIADCELGRETLEILTSIQEMAMRSDIDGVDSYLAHKDMLRQEALEAIEQYQYLCNDECKIVNEYRFFADDVENEFDEALEELREKYNN